MRGEPLLSISDRWGLHTSCDGSSLPIQAQLLGFEGEKVPPVSPELQYASFPTGTIRNLIVLPSGTLPLSLGAG